MLCCVISLLHIKACYFQICEFVLENPTDIPVVVHVVPVALYPNAQTLIDTIGHFLPPDITQDFLELDDGDVFSLRSLTESQNLRPVSGPSLVSMRRQVETSLGVRTNKSTLAFVLPSRTKISIEVVFKPKDDVLRDSLFIIRLALAIGLDFQINSGNILVIIRIWGNIR